jgi:hypothetical protein
LKARKHRKKLLFEVSIEIFLHIFFPVFEQLLEEDKEEEKNKMTTDYPQVMPAVAVGLPLSDRVLCHQGFAEAVMPCRRQ